MAKYRYEKTFTYDGKRYHVYGNTEEEAIRKLALKQKELEEGHVILSSSMTVAQWVPRCLDAYKPNVSEDYRKIIDMRVNKHIVSVIGHLPLSKVKPLQCQEILNAQAGMSKSHITKLHQELVFIFEKALENQLVLSNPAAHLVRPGGSEGKRRSMTQIERVHFLKVCDTDPVYIVFLLMLYCGCRPSEALKARENDIVEKDGVCFLHIRGTKTENADRYVPISLELLSKLPSKRSFDTIAKNHEGREHSESSYRKAVNSLKRNMNLSMGAKTYRNQLIPPLPLAPDFTPYILRHTFCTDLQKMGVDIRAAQKLMGHADISTTANIYSHQDDETLMQAARLMGVVSDTTLYDTKYDTLMS